MSKTQIAEARRILWRALRSLLAAMALFANFREERIQEIIGMNSLSGLLAGAGIYAIFSWMEKTSAGKRRGTSWTSFACAALFSVFTVIGKSFIAAESFHPISSSLIGALCATVVFVGCFFLFLEAIDFAYTLAAHRSNSVEGQGIFTKLFPEDARVWRVALIILFCWLPYFIVDFPGGMTNDMGDQLGQFFGQLTRSAGLADATEGSIYLNTMNPVPHTLLLGSLCALLKRGQNVLFGIFVFSLLQAIAYAFVFARSISMMRRFGMSRNFRLIALAFYCLNPLVPMFAYSDAKDSAFALLMLIVSILVAETYADPERSLNSPAKIAAIAIFDLLFILFRSSGIYLAIVFVPVAYFVISSRIDKGRIKPRIALISALVLPTLLSVIVTGVVYPSVGIRKGTSREDKSILFQQSARYAIDYRDEVTEEERAAISAVLPFDSFAEKYLPGRSDPIKNEFNESATEEQLNDYYRVWFEQFQKHPLNYVEAAISMNYAYYYPDMNLDDYWLMYYIGRDKSWHYGDWQIYVDRPDFFKPLTSLLHKGLQFLSIVPVVGALFTIAMYSWTLITALFFSLRARARAGMLLLPYLALLLGLGLTPLNGSTRYAIGLITALPFIVTIGIYAARHPGGKAAQISV